VGWGGRGGRENCDALDDAYLRLYPAACIPILRGSSRFAAQGTAIGMGKKEVSWNEGGGKGGVCCDFFVRERFGKKGGKKKAQLRTPSFVERRGTGDLLRRKKMAGVIRTHFPYLLSFHTFLILCRPAAASRLVGGGKKKKGGNYLKGGGGGREEEGKPSER